jgi:replicative DNA helicase
MARLDNNSWSRESSYRLDIDSIDFMVRHYANDEDLVSECSALFKDNYFSEDEKHYMLIIKFIRLYKLDFGDRPNPEALRIMVNDNDLVRNGYTMANQVPLKDACYDIIKSIGAFTPEDIVKNRVICREIIKRFLVERGFHDAIYNNISTINSAQSVIKEPSKFVESITNVLNEIQSVESSAVFSVVPDVWKPNIVVGDSIGIPYLDMFMTGGVRAGDVYGVLGGFGSGKTWIGINVITHFCKNENHRKIKCKMSGAPYKPKIGVLAHYEDSLDSIRFRLLASMADMPMKHVMEYIINGTPLSTRSTYREYELKRYASISNDSIKRPEVERFEEAKVILADHCRIISLNGENQQHKGKGYIDELTAQLNSCVKSSSSDLGVCVLDYAKLMAERHVTGGKDGFQNLRHYIKAIPERVSLEICNKFKCYAVVLQQLSGASTKTRPGMAIHHSEASECKDFAENCHRVFCLGNKHPQSGVQRFDASKLRNDEFKSKNYAVIRFNGDTCNYEVDDDWVVDDHSGFAPAGIAGSSMSVAPTRRASTASLSSLSDMDDDL